MSGYYLLKNGEYAYNKSYSVGYDFGSIKRLELYPMGALSTLYICFALKKYNSDYIKVYFDSLKWYKEIYMISAEGARNHGLLNVPTDDFFDTYHYITEDINEQVKIAKVMELLDQKIQKQQELVENLKKYKRGLISEILKQKLVITHEDETWEDVSLSDVADGFEYGMNAAATSFDGEHKYIRITDINDDAHTYIDCDPVSPAGVLEEKYRVVEDDILFARTGASAGKSYLYRKNDGVLFFAGFLIRIHVKEGVDSEYVFLNTLTEEYDKWVMLESARSGQPGINAEQYKRYRFKLPSLRTQRRIAIIAQKFDAQIQKETMCLRLLQEQRHGLLQQLFI